MRSDEIAALREKTENAIKTENADYSTYVHRKISDITELKEKLGIPMEIQKPPEEEKTGKGLKRRGFIKKPIKRVLNKSNKKRYY